MYFKRLELFGFKSFAERTRLDFEPGITAIVGPNGCGKSNIADSIKWVLGEQSAKVLRGGRMEDVIFNGTDGKEPVGYAEVSLTLDNHDRMLPIEYDEVTVSRRLYRSGESEYLLNKTPVRLKDINELFMGTGIGTNAYSLIEQGRIDQVLSSKPEERREVFEEASGITKYKAKKKEALRKLEDTEQNLVRINDIIQEVKRQINSTERQAKKAERYKEKYEELKSIDLKLSRIELEALTQKLSQSNENLDDFKMREKELDCELQDISAELRELNLDRSRIETKRMNLKSSIIEIDSEASKAGDKIILNRERIGELKQKRADLASEIEKGEESRASQEKEVAGLRGKVNVLETDRAGRSEALAAKEKRLSEISKSITEYETTISTSKANLLDLASGQSKLRNQQARISTTISAHDTRLKRLDIELNTIQEESNNLSSRLNEIAAQKEQVESEARSLRSEKDRISRSATALSVRIEELTEKSHDLHRNLGTNRSRLEILEEAKAKYEGFSSGVKAILGMETGNAGRPIQDARDVLANLITVTKGYETAIESALGDNLQAIIVDTMDAAKKGVDFLKEHSCGRASFIYPEASTTQSPDSRGHDLNGPGVLGRASDFINIDSRYEGLLKSMLKNVFVAENIEHAAAVLNNNPGLEGINIVTLSGEVISKGFVSGGDISKEGTTLINRDARIKEISEAIAETEKTLRLMEESKENAEKEKEELIKISETTAAGLSEKEILLANARSRYSNIEENLKGVRDEISLVKLEIDEVEAETESLKKEESSVAEALLRAEADTGMNEEKIKTCEALIVEYAKEKEKLLIETVEQRTELGTVESRREGLFNTLQILEKSLRDSEISLESRKSEIEDSARKTEELSADITGLESKVLTLSEDKIGKDKDLAEVEAGYQQIMHKIEQNEGIFKQSEKELNALRSNLHGIDLKKAETNYSIENLKQRVKDVYKIGLETVDFNEDWQATDMDALKQEVEEKREKLDAMGTVNLVAIEEHSELQDRHAFLTHQRDDLLSAKESLLKAIGKINKTTKDLFIQTFQSIQAEFRNFFKMLFGGGDGELILLDEGNVLESGIEIVARPPGKRLQNVSLLSGGERALTAISLIFAIFKVKPSPFCVLDEIDAPLDESNVGRYSRSLSMFTDTSQFIVITHNKKTIDMADVMYGITMQQSGISKVVSVKFSDAKKQEEVKA
jgi:chromosome segregation protein